MNDMNEHQNKQAVPMQDKVLAAIEAGQVKMRPRWHFVLQATLMAVGGVLLLLILVYLASFIIFSLRQTGVLFVPFFGSAGWREFLGSLPWILILLTGLFVVVMEVLVRRYAFAYRQPLLASALGVIAVVILGGVIVAQTPFHRRLFESARNGQLPLAGPFYRQFGMPRLENVHRGTIVEIVPDGFILREMEGETSTVMIVPQTHLPFGDGFVIGDGIVVFGPESAGPGTSTLIQALGVQKIDTSDMK
jgi:hypothetical protein